MAGFEFDNNLLRFVKEMENGDNFGFLGVDRPLKTIMIGVLIDSGNRAIMSLQPLPARIRWRFCLNIKKIRRF